MRRILEKLRGLPPHLEHEHLVIHFKHARSILKASGDMTWMWTDTAGARILESNESRVPWNSYYRSTTHYKLFHNNTGYISLSVQATIVQDWDADIDRERQIYIRYKTMYSSKAWLPYWIIDVSFHTLLSTWPVKTVSQMSSEHLASNKCCSWCHFFCF